MKPTKALLAGTALLCLTTIAEAQNYNQLIGLGDSTTDTGWFANAKLSPVPNLFDFAVASSLAAGGNAHLPAPVPATRRFGTPLVSGRTPQIRLGGTNYAIGGAFDNAGPPGFSAFTNILLIDSGLPPNPALPPTTGQISNYLASVNGKANPNALYLISSGGNDFFIAQALGLSTAAATAWVSYRGSSPGQQCCSTSRRWSTLHHRRG